MAPGFGAICTGVLIMFAEATKWNIDRSSSFIHRTVLVVECMENVRVSRVCSAALADHFTKTSAVYPSGHRSRPWTLTKVRTRLRDLTVGISAFKVDNM